MDYLALISPFFATAYAYWFSTREARESRNETIHWEKSRGNVAAAVFICSWFTLIAGVYVGREMEKEKSAERFYSMPEGCQRAVKEADRWRDDAEDAKARADEYRTERPF